MTTAPMGFLVVGGCFIMGDGEHDVPVLRIYDMINFDLRGFDEELAVFVEVEFILLE
jgi:hypothetical protein